ncbi:MAG: hypothetical protein OEW69_07455 [Nitrospirota bacterium]|nr:hypothetical protein [Nitrospirota bacterium]
MNIIYKLIYSKMVTVIKKESLMNSSLFFVIIFILILFCANHTLPSLSFAEDPLAFGEMNAAGDVKMLSSTGQWVDVKGVYPLLKETKLKTGVGTVSVTTKGGSRIDLLKDTEVSVIVVNSTYTFDILNCTGNLSFNMTPPELLTATTPESTLVIVQKTDVSSQTNVRGTVLNKANGTEVRSLLGKFSVSHHGLTPQVLNTGESVFVGGECIVATLAREGGTTKIRAGIIPGALFIAGGAVFATEGFRKDRVATPSGF